MKKILSLVTIAVLSFGYEGCGIDKKEALNNLSQSIYVQVNNSFTKNEELHQGLTTSFSKDIKNEVSLTSNLVLKNVKYITKNGQICAEVDKKDVIQSAQATLKDLMNFNTNKLPKEFKSKQKMAKNILAKISFVKAILGDKISSYQLSKLNSLEKSLKDITNQGGVIFNVNAPNAKIKISGKFFSFSPSEEILLEPGKYSYEVYGSGIVPQKGEFEIKAGEEKQISINVDFTKDLEKAKEKSDYFLKSKEIDINYAYGIAPQDKEEWDSQKRIEVRSFTNYGIYKLGYGLLAGTNTHWTAKDMDELEVVVGARLQFDELFDKTFRIKNLPILPFIGVEGGFDIYKALDNLNNGDNVSKHNFTTIVRGQVGATFLFHKQFGINILYAHDFFDKKDNIISVGVVLDFSFDK